MVDPLKADASAKSFVIDGISLTEEDVYTLSTEGGWHVSIADSAREPIRRSRALVESWVKEGRTIYGITTGFGEFANVSIPPDKIEELQQNIVRSHASGVGEPLDNAVVRAMLLLRANALVKGCSGIRIEVIETLLALIAHDALPYIPSRGSVGSSGDLAPLSHIALALTGEGYITLAQKAEPRSGALQLSYQLPGRDILPAAEALREVGIMPIIIKAKEGLALINGTQMMTAIGCLSLAKAKRLAELADVSASLSFEALRATDKAFDERIHAARPHKGQRFVAEHMRNLTAGSEIRESHREDDPRVQDAYSLRCIPQVHGAVRDTLRFVEEALRIEINSVTDNPLIVPDGSGDGGIFLEGGNFHGEPIALPLDYLAIALSELANISERRTERLVNGALSGGLPRFLTRQGGLNSGFMIAQYAAAALVSENKIYAHPASVDSIPTSANQEDHNSMGSIGALKLQRVLDNLEYVLAIEFLCAAQGVEFLAPLKPGKGSGAAYSAIRAVVPAMEHDRFLSPDIEALRMLIRSGELLASVDAALA